MKDLGGRPDGLGEVGHRRGRREVLDGERHLDVHVAADGGEDEVPRVGHSSGTNQSTPFTTVHSENRLKSLGLRTPHRRTIGGLPQAAVVPSPGVTSRRVLVGDGLGERGDE